MGNDKVVAAVLEDWRTAPINERLRSMLGFLEKLTLSSAEVTAEDVTPLRSVGLSDRAIEEAIYVCFLFNMMDRFADAFDFHVFSSGGFQKAGRSLYTRGYKGGSIPG